MNPEYSQIKDVLGQIGDIIFNWHALTIVAIAAILTVAIISLLSSSSVLIVKALTKFSDKGYLNSHNRIETWLNVVMSIIKILVIVVVFYVTWRLLSPSSAPLALFSAGTLLVVLASGTIGLLLRDYTIGSMMIAEKWYGIGDFIKVEPFLNVEGVVERITLKSTKIRDLSGAVYWVHNQNIQAVKVKYRGVSTIALDVFVKDRDKALGLLEHIVEIVPKGQMLVIGGLKITDKERLNDQMWRIELRGKTVPGREWLIENFARDAIVDADNSNNDKDKIIIYGPITRYIDQAAEKRFKRIIK
jgi:small conductance mechanosensitive channel